MDRGVNTNLHPLFVSTERRRKKHRNLIVFGAAGAARARAARISYSPVRPANTIICRFKRDALFSVPLFSNFTSAPCFFLNRKWDTSDEKLTKIWPTPMENSGFCDRICRIPRSLYRKFYLQDCFLVCHVFVMLIVFFYVGK